MLDNLHPFLKLVVLSGPVARKASICCYLLAGDDELGAEGGDVEETDDADLDDDWGLDTE